MAKSRFTIIRGIGVNFRNTIQTVHDQLIACGLVQSSDSGQLDIAGFTIPTADASVGYLVYQLADSLAASLPVKLRIHWYSRRNSNVTTEFVPACAAQVFNNSDGAGNPSPAGAVITSIVIPSDATAQTALSDRGECFINIREGSIIICLGAKWHKLLSVRGSCLLFIVVSRMRDSSGNPTADGVVVCTGGQSLSQGALRVGSISSSGATPQGTSGYTILAPLIGDSTSASVGGKPQLQHPWAATPRLYPLEEIAMYAGASTFSTGDTLDVDIGGSTRTYMALQDVGAQPGMVGSSSVVGDAGLAFLWED